MKIINGLFYCNGCFDQKEFLVAINSNIAICEQCIGEAYELFENRGRCPDCGDYGIIQYEHGRNSTCPCHLPKIENDNQSLRVDDEHQWRL